MALKTLSVKFSADTVSFEKGLKSIQTGIKKLSSSAKKISTGISSGMKSLYNNVKNLSDGTTTLSNDVNNLTDNTKELSGGIKSVAKSALAFVSVTAAISGAARAVKSYTALESDILRVNSLFGESTKYIQYFAKVTGKSLGMAESSAYQYAATYGTLLKGFTADAEENSKVTIAMLKASSVVASKTGRTIEDVMERIRSGLLGNTEAIEDLGINVNVAMLETTEAFKKIADGRSWEQLEFYEQQQIRTLAILEQANENFGDSVQKGSAYNISVLSGAFSDLTAAAGELINAGLQPIIKSLTDIVRWATAGMKALAGMMGIKTSGDVSEQINSQADAQNVLADSIEEATEAATEQQKVLSGFDELNMITSDTGSEASTASSDISGSVFDSIEMPEYEFIGEEYSAPIAAFAEKVKGVFSSLSGINFANITAAFSGLKTAVEPLTKSLFEGLEWAWSSILVPLGEWVVNDVAPAFLEALSFAAGMLSMAIETLQPLGQWLWDSLLLPIATWSGGVVVDVLNGIGKGLNAISEWIKNNKELVRTITIIIGSFAAAWTIVNTAIKVWNVISSVATVLTTAFGSAVAFLTSPVGLVVLAIGALIAIVVLLVKNWDKVKETAIKVWNKIKETWSKVSDWINDNVIKPIAKFFSDLWYGIEEDWSSVSGWFREVFSDAWEGIKSAWSGTKDFFGGVWNGIKGAFGSVSDWFKNTFKKAWEGVKNVFSKGGKIFSGIKDGIADVFKSVVNSLIGGINTVISKPFNLINGMLNKIRGIDILGLKPFEGMWGENPLAVPQIPKLAKGGVIDSPTVAMIGEAGEEAVMPLERNTGWIEQLAQKIALSIQSTQMQPALADGDVPNVYVYIGNDQLDSHIIKVQRNHAIKTNGRSGF